MSRKYLEMINSILEHIQRMDPEQTAQLHESLTGDGFGYPEKHLSHLQEEVTNRLSEFGG